MIQKKEYFLYATHLSLCRLNAHALRHVDHHLSLLGKHRAKGNGLLVSSLSLSLSLYLSLAGAPAALPSASAGLDPHRAPMAALSYQASDIISFGPRRPTLSANLTYGMVV